MENDHFLAIKIFRAPVGPAPQAIRDAWIGLTIPIEVSPKIMFDSFPAFSDSILAITGIFFGVYGIKPGVRGYLVNCLLAFQILDQVNPEAVEWWRSHKSHFFYSGRMFVFDAGCCELITGGPYGPRRQASIDSDVSGSADVLTESHPCPQSL